MSKSLLVYKGNNTIITPEILSCYVDAYTIYKTDDPDKRFADLIGTTIADASTLAYFIGIKMIECKNNYIKSSLSKGNK